VAHVWRGIPNCISGRVSEELVGRLSEGAVRRRMLRFLVLAVRLLDVLRFGELMRISARAGCSELLQLLCWVLQFTRRAWAATVFQPRPSV